MTKKGLEQWTNLTDQANRGWGSGRANGRIWGGNVRAESKDDRPIDRMVEEGAILGLNQGPWQEIGG
jgi:hypothetical protein